MKPRAVIKDVSSMRSFLRQSRDLSNVVLRDFRAREESFYGINLKDSAIVSCEFYDVDFSNSNMSGVEIIDSRAERSSFAGSLMRNSSISECSFSHCDFNRAVMTGINAENVFWNFCSMKYVDMRNCLLIGCRVWDSNLNRADLRFSDLRQCDWYCVDLSGANLHGSFFKDTDFVGVKFDVRTVFPEGYGLKGTDRRIVRLVKEHLDIASPGSSNFRRWFGSSVVSRDGDPLVVYHGTRRGGFLKFSHEMIDRHHPGFFFTDDLTLASTYAGNLSKVPDPVMYDVSSGVYRVYLKAENPYVIDAGGKWWNFVLDEKFGSGPISKIAHLVRSAGYDALIVKNVRDSMNPDEYDEPATVYVVFDPLQIKSATANTGEYSLTDPDITKNPRRKTSRGTRKRTSRTR